MNDNDDMKISLDLEPIIKMLENKIIKDIEKENKLSAKLLKCFTNNGIDLLTAMTVLSEISKKFIFSYRACGGQKRQRRSKY